MIRLFRVFIPATVLTLLASEIVIVFGCFLLAIAQVPDISVPIFLIYENGLASIALVVTAVLLTLYYQDLYNDVHVASKYVLIQKLLLTIGIVFIFESAIAYLTPELMLPRHATFFGCLFLLPALALWRMLFSTLVVRALGTQAILFLGSNAVAREVIKKISCNPELGFSALGILDDSHPVGEMVAGAPVLGPMSAILDVTASKRPDRIVVGMTERRQAMPVHELLNLRFQGIRVEEAAVTYESIFGRVSTTELRPSQLIYSSDLGPLPSSMRTQMIYSTAIAVIAFVVLLPLTLLVALAVRLTSRGPVLFRQRRVGLNGKIFTLFKFRSMVVDAEAKTGAVWAQPDDPRVTPIGRFLRMSRLDELPQLINVLRGEMSLVGPRPERPEFVDVLSQLIAFYPQRHSVRPGITGWAQVNYKYGNSTEDTVIKLEYDLYYIKNLSVTLDFYIIFQTIKVMLFTKSGH
jgi:exopolysaccharide biosynthesis polyprenyl glycosylphosphotransferase